MRARKGIHKKLGGICKYEKHVIYISTLTLHKK